MAKYRKKPVVIEAIQWHGDTRALTLFLGGSGRFYFDAKSLIIPTLEGDMRASLGDYIIRGVAGEFYPCKPDIFDKTYELCEDEERNGG